MNLEWTCKGMSHACGMQVGMAKFDISGEKYGRLTAVSRTEHAGSCAYWTCQCECGETCVVATSDLRSGHTRSCGCLRREIAPKASLTHGNTRGRRFSPTYVVWTAIKMRCLRASSPTYKDYGARGITVCDRWRDSFEAFLADMGERPSRKHSIDRINNSKGYEPGNCRWATQAEQVRNSRSCKLTVDQVREVLGRIEHGEPVKSVAARFPVSLYAIRDIATGRNWKDIFMEGRS